MSRQLEIARRVRNLRRTQKIRAVDLAREVGMSRSSYYHFEAGERALTLEDAVLFARVLGVSLDYIAGNENGYHKVGT